MKSLMIRLGMLALMLSALAGCSGSDGSAGPAGAPGAPISGSGLIGVTNLTPTEWQALKPKIDPASITVSIGSKPVVKFKVTDLNGNPLVGLGGQALSAANTTNGLPHVNYNLAFSLAKLVPGNGGPSKWVNYLVTSPIKAGTTNGVVNGGVTWKGNVPQQEREGTLVDNGDGTYQYTFFRDITQTAAIVSQLTDTDTLTVKALKSDLGNTTYEPTLTHRLGIILSGSQPGTGTNTPDAVQVTNPVPLVYTFNIGYDFVPAGGAVTTTRDIVTKDSCTDCHAGRGIGHISTTGVSASGIPNGVPPGSYVGRNDPKLCVTCHTDQAKYGFPEVTKVGTTGYSGIYARVDGEAAFTFPRMIHKFHMGEKLLKTGYNLNLHCNDPREPITYNPAKPVANSAACFNTVGWPQDPRDCTKCHDGSATKSDGSVNTKKTTNGDNWKNVPSILACGACHDGINFADGTGTTLAGATTGHAGGTIVNDSQCSTCHNAATIPVDHATNLATLNNPLVKPGTASISFDISSVTINASKQPVITFQIKKSGVIVTSLALPNMVTHATNGQQVVDPAFEPIPGFAGGPTLYAAYAVPEDGIAAPADFNAYQSASLTNLLIASGSPKAGSLSNTVSGGVYQADANGYFTATLTGDTLGQPKGAGCVAPTAPNLATCVSTAVLASPIVIPTTATMVTGTIIGSFTQKGVTDPVTSTVTYAYTAANVSVNPTTAASGGLNVPGLLKKTVATGYTARRVITDKSKCNACHDQLGTSPAFHGQTIAGELEAGTGPRNDPTACNICHNGNRTSNGWTANSSTHIHGIHAASKRSVPNMWAATAVDDNFSQIQFPGLVKNCNACHLADTVNFGVTGGATVQPNLMWSTIATGKYDPASTTAFRNSPYITADNIKNYGNNFSFTPEGATVSAYTNSSGVVTAAHVAAAGGEIVAADPQTLVNSPMSSACFACHDTDLAKSHMENNGGAIHQTRASQTVSGKLVNRETCLVCHGKGRVADVAVIHKP